MKTLKRRQKKQLAFLSLLLLVASILAVMLLTPGFDIKEIKVRGNSVLKEDEIIRASGIVKGVNIFGVSLSEAKDNIKSMGYIENVKIKRSLPSTVEITVEEEVGVACLHAEAGYAIITAKGKCVEIVDINSPTKKKDKDKNASKKVSAPKLPVIKGLKNVKYKVGSIITADDELQLEELFISLHAFSKHGYVFDMKEIDVSNIENIYFTYKHEEVNVRLGNTENIDHKMEVFRSILAQIANPAGLIDLERQTHTPPMPKKITVQPAQNKE
ncbi:MAG: FtsQ-type POTRA domain-containing protein [Clostridia bacterium]|nr:FtsQ-type POTRA domain-containing protein [Clostridia bacterium]